MSDPFHIEIPEDVFTSLREIFEYIQKDSPQNATAMINRVLKAIDSLEVMPARYGVVGHSRKRKTPVHRWSSSRIRSITRSRRLNEPSQFWRFGMGRGGS